MRQRGVGVLRDSWRGEEKGGEREAIHVDRQGRA